MNWKGIISTSSSNLLANIGIHGNGWKCVPSVGVTTCLTVVSDFKICDQTSNQGLVGEYSGKPSDTCF